MRIEFNEYYQTYTVRGVDKCAAARRLGIIAHKSPPTYSTAEVDDMSKQ